jgi:TRAP-type mannitol/chloroaromatic compound transport system permease large subunit
MLGRAGPPLRTITGGLAIAVVIAFTMAVPSVGTVSTWKIVLGAIGLVIFLLGGSKR